MNNYATVVVAVCAAIAAAEIDALRQHRTGTCHTSEWSCSHCEAENLPAHAVIPDHPGVSS